MHSWLTLNRYFHGKRRTENEEPMTESILQLRKELHQNPEVSGKEAATALRIKNFIEEHHNTTIISGIGGNGLAAIYEFSKDGPVIMIRCELDALPIEEKNTFSHRSLHSKVSHKCGHDGHMAIVAGLIFWLKEQSFKAGKIILMFQPAEENGEGAFAVLNDPKFRGLAPEYIFALHNLPGEPVNSIIVVENVFSSTVQSVAISLNGKTSHASEPEKGKNPSRAIATIINKFSEFNKPDITNSDFTLLTPVCIKMGTLDYGISPGTAELHYTLRSISEEVMKKLKDNLLKIIEEVCKEEGLEFSADWLEYFPATINDDFCNEQVRQAAENNGLKVIERSNPLKFGEDFGWFSKNHKVSLFGLGAGENSPALHHSDYDFPDEVIPTGIMMFRNIIQQILSKRD